MMDLGKRRCLQVPTRRTVPVNDQRCVFIFAAQNGGRDRALLQNDRRKLLNSFPFFFIPKDRLLCHQNSHFGRGKKSK